MRRVVELALVVCGVAVLASGVGSGPTPRKALRVLPTAPHEDAWSIACREGYQLRLEGKTDEAVRHLEGELMASYSGSCGLSSSPQRFTIEQEMLALEGTILLKQADICAVRSDFAGAEERLELACERFEEAYRSDSAERASALAQVAARRVGLAVAIRTESGSRPRPSL